MQWIQAKKKFENFTVSILSTITTISDNARINECHNGKGAMATLSDNAIINECYIGNG